MTDALVEKVARALNQIRTGSVVDAAEAAIEVCRADPSFDLRPTYGQAKDELRGMLDVDYLIRRLVDAGFIKPDPAPPVPHPLYVSIAGQLGVDIDELKRWVEDDHRRKEQTQ